MNRIDINEDNETLKKIIKENEENSINNKIRTTEGNYKRGTCSKCVVF